MMKIKIIDLFLCKTGGTHVVFDVFVNDNFNRRYSTTMSALAELMDETPDRSIALILMHGHCKKLGAETLPQMRAALLDQEFFW